MGLTRRAVLGGVAATAAAGMTARGWGIGARALTSLKEAAALNGLLAGCAVAVPRLKTDPAYNALLRAQAGIVVAENAFKFGPLRPSPTSFDFTRSDELAAFAAENGMKLRGHNFVWHRGLPAWFLSTVTPANAAQVLVEHIERVGGRYAGRIHSWDVVNEAIQVSDGLEGGLRRSPWQRLLPGYIDLAFRTARQVDPRALLVYNDYGIEGEDAASAKKRAAVLGLLRGMQQRGVPVDALGVQSHLSAGPEASYGSGLMAMLAEARRMGLKVLVTEMDVNDRRLGPEIAARDAAVAARYASYLKTVLFEPAVIAVLTWGITDKYTWLNGEDARSDGLPERPLPFDAEMQAKPAYTAELTALGSAPRR